MAPEPRIEDLADFSSPAQTRLAITSPGAKLFAGRSSDFPSFSTTKKTTRVALSSPELRPLSAGTLSSVSSVGWFRGKFDFGVFFFGVFDGVFGVAGEEMKGGKAKEKKGDNK